MQKNRRAAVIVVMDRSQSIPSPLRQAALNYAARTVTAKGTQDRLAVIDVAEAARISRLPSDDTAIQQRETQLTGPRDLLWFSHPVSLDLLPPGLCRHHRNHPRRGGAVPSVAGGIWLMLPIMASLCTGVLHRNDRSIGPLLDANPIVQVGVRRES